MSFDNDQTQLPKDSSGSESLFLGQLLGQYKVIRLLGRGGMGEVYEVEHAVLGKRYALKLLSQKIIGQSGALERFKREAKVMARLEHTNILQVDEFGETDGFSWLRMPLVKGVDFEHRRCISLADAMASARRFSEQVAAQYIEQILKGLGHAHSQGVVHRDMKPSNILIGADGRLKLADFGLVKVADSDWMKTQVQLTVARSLTVGDDATRLEGSRRSQGTSTAALLGTYEYMSPEARKGEEATAQSDLFAVGLIAFRLLTGEAMQGLDMPSELVEGLSPEWDDWMKRAAAPRLGRRFIDAEAMLQAMPANKAKPIEKSHSTMAQPATLSEPVENSVAQKASHADEKRGAAKTPASVKQEKPVHGKDYALILPDGQKLDLKWIESGTFSMGSPERIVEGGFMGFGGTVKQEGEEGRNFGETQHSVTLTKGFWLGETAVTQGQWEAVMGSNPSRYKGRDLPVETTSWKDAMSFCSKLTERERAAGRLAAGYEYTLPTESQWEYACRAGSTGAYWGDLDSMGWYDKNSGSKPHPVGQKRGNTWGLYDMHGNVWEWCSDWYGDYPSGSVVDPTGASSGTFRVNRGGSWDFYASCCRSAIRNWYTPDDRGGSLGFRLAHAPTR